jgi:peptidoglycan hydrolase-like protein with peptidoglycan-binding domain
MSRLPARLVFLAFIGLTGLITYNALYLQKPPGLRGRAIAQAGAAANQGGSPTGAIDPSSGSATGAKPKAQMQEASEALVTAVQRELAERGYHPGPDNGVVTKQTSDAIAAYQKDHKLPQTGQPSDALLRHIVLGESVDELGETSSVASVDMPPAMIKAVQQVLARLGYAPGPVDGRMGQNTKDAIKAFQKDRGIAQNGDITPQLLQEMERVTGRKFAGGILYH